MNYGCPNVLRDPIEERGELNLYGFVGNDGLNWFDILGLQAMMICNRCKQNGVQSCITYDDEDGISSDPFPTNPDPSLNQGKIPPGLYDLLPKPPSGMNPGNRQLPPANIGRGKVTGPGGTEFPRGTPSITGPGRNPGSPAPRWKDWVRIHGPGLSTGCLTTPECGRIQKMMEDNLESGGMTLRITDVTCECIDGKIQPPPNPVPIRRAIPYSEM